MVHGPVIKIIKVCENIQKSPTSNVRNSQSVDLVALDGSSRPTKYSNSCYGFYLGSARFMVNANGICALLPEKCNLNVHTNGAAFNQSARVIKGQTMFFRIFDEPFFSL